MKSLNPFEWLRKAETSVLSAWQMVSFTVPETNPSIVPSQILQNADIRIPSEQMNGVPTEDELVFIRKAFAYILSWRGEKTALGTVFCHWSPLKTKCCQIKSLE